MIGRRGGGREKEGGWKGKEFLLAKYDAECLSALLERMSGEGAVTALSGSFNTAQLGWGRTVGHTLGL